MLPRRELDALGVSMPTLSTDHGQLITEFRAATVEIKQSLDDAVWTATTFLYCDKLTLAVNAYDEAELSRELGDMLHFGTDFYAQYSPLALLGRYVRITIHPDEDTADSDIVWVGFIIGTAKQRSAVKGEGMAQLLTGKKQVLRAVGMEYFLDRVQIYSAVVGEDTVIQRTLPFNGGKGVSLDADTRTRANRSDATNGDGSYTFAASGETGELWKLGEIVDYLTAYYTTRTTADVTAPAPFRLNAGDAFANVLAGIAPTLDPDGMTVFQVLSKLLSPQRGFVWWLEYVEGAGPPGVCEIRVETLAASAITLPSTGTVPANRDQQTLDFDTERDVEDVIMAEAGSRVYHQIIARGARMTSTGTLAVAGDGAELIVDWQSVIEDGYKAASSSEAGYAALTTAQKKTRNDAFQKAERFYRVYSAFRLDPAWDGKSGDGGDGDRNWTFPVLSNTGSVLGTLEYAIEGLRLLNLTRLKRGWNYQDTSDIEETQPTGSEAEYMPTFAILQVAEAESASVPEKYQFVEKMSEHDFAAGGLVSDKISTSYNLRMQQTVPGVLLDSDGVQHAAALNHWTAAEPTGTDPQVDYATLRVTTTIEADSYAEGKFPADVDLPAGVPLQKLVLYAGDEYRLDFLAANTIVDLRNGEPVLTNGGVLRDNRPHLNDIARVAYEWYQQDRLPVTMTFRQVRNLFRLGMLITTIGSSVTQETVNSVVSMITYDLTNGSMTIKTNDEDLDLTRVV